MFSNATHQVGLRYTNSFLLLGGEASSSWLIDQYQSDPNVGEFESVQIDEHEPQLSTSHIIAPGRPVTIIHTVTLSPKSCSLVINTLRISLKLICFR